MLLNSFRHSYVRHPIYQYIFFWKWNFIGGNLFWHVRTYVSLSLVELKNTTKMKCGRLTKFCTNWVFSFCLLPLSFVKHSARWFPLTRQKFGCVRRCGWDWWATDEQLWLFYIRTWSWLLNYWRTWDFVMSNVCILVSR